MLWGDMVDQYPYLPNMLRARWRVGFFLGGAVGCGTTLLIWWLS